MQRRSKALTGACLFLPILAAGAVRAEPAVPRFADVTAQAGIDTVYEGGWEYMVGGGVAVFDCNADGKQDMLIAGGGADADFYVNASAPGGDLTFETRESGLEHDSVTGAYPVDIDSDGLMDVVLLRVGENLVMRGRPGCRFERANEAWGFDGGDAWSTAFAATFEAGSDWPTLAVGNYIDRTEEMFPWGSCTDNWLHRPRAHAPGFASPSALSPSYCALSMLFTDWNRSGTPALRVSNDREYYRGGQEQLWRVEPGSAPTLYTSEDGWQRLQVWGMGIASYDVDFNGYPEYFLTSMADNKLQALTPDAVGEALAPSYEDIAYARGVTAHRPYTGGEIKPSTAWHTQFEDVNNDRLVDLFIAKGNVWEMPDFALKDPNNLLLQSTDGGFVEAGDQAGVASMKTARGAALADFNLDGLIDLIVVNRHDGAELWQNRSGDAGHWLMIDVAQEAPNRQAIGGWIEVRVGETVLRREMTLGGGHASGQAGWWHFGLGDAQRAEVRVIWPDGGSEPWQDVQADGLYRVRRHESVQKIDPATMTAR